MEPSCARCELDLRREPGYYLGSIYFNYGVTALVVTVAYFVCHFGTTLREDVLVGALAAYCFLFPLWFFRYARGLWLGFDELFDPSPTVGDRQS